MAKRKPKLPPISKARQAIFDAHQCDTVRAERLHEQAITSFDKLMETYKITATGDKETDGNAILIAYFDSLAHTNKHILCNRIASLQFAGPFFDLFRAQLSKYWEGNLMGFNLSKFDEDYIKSGDLSILDVVQEKWGDVGKHMIELLIDPMAHEAELNFQTVLTFPTSKPQS